MAKGKRVKPAKTIARKKSKSGRVAAAKKATPRVSNRITAVRKAFATKAGRSVPEVRVATAGSKTRKGFNDAMAYIAFKNFKEEPFKQFNEKPFSQFKEKPFKEKPFNQWKEYIEWKDR